MERSGRWWEEKERNGEEGGKGRGGKRKSIKGRELEG